MIGGDNTAWVLVWYCVIKGYREAKFVLKYMTDNITNCIKNLKEKHTILGR